MANVPGSIQELEINSSESFTKLQHDLSIFPRSDPRRLQTMLSLARKRYCRYRQLHQREDLDKAIVHLTELILLSPLSLLQHSPILLYTLLRLACALFLRSNVSKQPEDAICTTKYLFHLRDQPHEIPTTPRYRVTVLLVDALALQVRLEAGDTVQNIREMAVLSLELLETSDIDATHFIVLIYTAVTSKISPARPGQPLDELIDFSRVAMKRRPDLLEGHMTFAISLVYRYIMTCANQDYEEAASILDEIIANSSPGYSKARAAAAGLVTALASLRSTVYQTPENVEETIYRTRTWTSSSSHKEHLPHVVFDPEATAMERFRHFGSIEGVEESSGNSLGDDEFSQGYTRMIGTMKGLLFGIRNTDDTTEIDEAIKRGRSIALAPDPDAIILESFGPILFEAFLRTKKIEYINESISVRRQLIEIAFSPAVHSLALPLLSASLLARSQHFPGYRTQDLDEALELLSQFVSSSHASVPDRFQRACAWASFARDTRHSSVSTAYVTALSLMQDIVLFSPTLQLQHSTLATHES